MLGVGLPDRAVGLVQRHARMPTMVKYLCGCGAVIHTSGGIPNFQQWIHRVRCRLGRVDPSRHRGEALVAGLALTHWMPSIKQLCTASFVLVSLGIVLLVFCGIYALTDVVGVAKPVWPLTVMGRNTLLVYSLDMVVLWWIDSSVAVFTGRFRFIGLFGSVVQALAVSSVVWLVCLWLYRRQIVIKM